MNNIDKSKLQLNKPQGLNSLRSEYNPSEIGAHYLCGTMKHTSRRSLVVRNNKTHNSPSISCAEQ